MAIKHVIKVNDDGTEIAEHIECKGCIIDNACKLLVVFNNIYCPCSTCLVKMMCKADCPDFLKYKRKIEASRNLKET